MQNTINMIKKNILFILSVIAFCACNKKTEVTIEPQYSDTICVRLATIDEAKRLIAAEDSYTRSRSPFDIMSRLQNPNGTVEELTAMMVDGVREWSSNDAAVIDSIVVSLNDTIRKYNFKLPLPKEIVLVKSAMEDEGGAAGYTRSNWIALSEKFVTDMDNVYRRRLFLHELFHILTRNSIDFKRTMYSAIGFTVTDEELEYPADLKDRRISNPDVDRYDSYATFTIGGVQQKCAMLIYAKRPYETGTFFDYLEMGFIPYDDNMKPVKKDGATVVYSIKDIDDLFDKVGRNTPYMINPEEILADNFVIAFNNSSFSVQTPELRDSIRALMIGE